MNGAGEFLLLLLLSAVFAYSEQVGTPSGILLTAFGNGTRIRGVSDRLEKDFVLGGLIPIHGASSGGGTCGELQEVGGVEEMEAVLFALDRINSDPNLLPNLTLGYDIRDTCYSENIGLDETLDLIIVGTDRQFTDCNIGDPTLDASTNSSMAQAPTLGIIGPTASGVSVHVAGLGRLFEIPQVSFASSSALLNNRDKYSFFYRTIPPDNLQAKAMIAVLLQFNWTHVSIIYSRNAYGASGREEVVLLAEENGICIDLDEGIGSDFESGDFQGLASKIDNSTAGVVIGFTTLPDMEALFNEIVTMPSFSRLTWIASDTWAEADSILDYFRRQDLLGSGGFFGITPLAKHFNDFHLYFTNLTIESNQRNPWFVEYFSAQNNCKINVTCEVNASITEVSQRSQIPRVIDAVYSLAYALDDFLNDNCDKPIVWYRENMTCIGQKRLLNGTNLLAYLANVSFASPTGTEIKFDHQGNIINTQYEVKNFQATNGIKLQSAITDIGVWSTNGSALEDDNIGTLLLYEGSLWQFGTDDNGYVINEPSISECGRCTPGQYHEPVVSSCCGICQLCLGQQFSDESQAPRCKNCSDLGESWGNNPLDGSNGCLQIKEVFLDFSDPYSIVITIIASIGLVAVVITAIVFGLHWGTPVVKSSSREQMVLLMIGISLSFILAYFYVAPPLLGVCIIQRIGLWFCYSLMFGALLIKVIRIARIFFNKSDMKKLRFAETHYQILFTFIVVIGQMLLVAASIAYEQPSIDRELRLNKNDNNDFPEVVVTCNGDPLAFILLSVVYETVLIVLMTVLGVVSFKFPANFNEAKHVSFCTFALLIIWIGFIPSYFATQQVEEYQDAVISMAIVMSAIAVLACVFGPRLYIILFQSERNSKEYSRNKGVLTTRTVEMTKFTKDSVGSMSAVSGKNDSSELTLVNLVAVQKLQQED